METRIDESCKWRRVEAFVLGLLLLAPLTTDPWGSLILTSKALHITIFAGLLAAAFLFRFFFKYGFKFIPSWADLPWGLFLLFGALSLAWSINKPVHLQRMILLLSITIPYLIVRVRLAEGNGVFQYILILLGVGFLVALIDSWGIVFLQSDDAPPMEGAVIAETFKTDSVLFPHHNVASIYTIILFPLALSALFYAERRGIKVFCCVCMVTLITYLVLLKSRAALAEACLGIVVIGTVLWIRAKTAFRFQSFAAYMGKWPVLLCLAAVVLLVFLLPLHKGFTFYAKGGFLEFVKFFDLDYNRAFFRLDIWRKTMAMVSDHFWLGVGLGNFPVIFPAYHKLEILKSHPHSEYFNVLSELGILGMTLYAAFLVMLFKAFLNGLCRGKGRDQVLALGLGCALLMAGVHGFVEPLMIFEASALNLLFCSGLLLHLEQKALGARAVAIGSGGIVRRVLIPALFLAGLLFLLPKFAFAFTNSLVLDHANTAMKRGQFVEAETQYRKALRRSWGSHFLHTNLGDACFYQGQEREAEAKALESQALVLEKKAKEYEGQDKKLEAGRKRQEARAKLKEAKEMRLEARRKYQDAYGEYLEAEALFPYYFLIYFKKGVALENLKRHEEAVEALTQCLAYSQRYQPAKIERIKVLFQMERFDDAFSQLGSYLRSKKPNEFDLWKAGDMYERASFHKERDDKSKLKDLRNALKCFEKCLKIPGSAEKFPRLRDSINHIRLRIRHLERLTAIKS